MVWYDMVDLSESPVYGRNSPLVVTLGHDGRAILGSHPAQWEPCFKRFRSRLPSSGIPSSALRSSSVFDRSSV